MGDSAEIFETQFRALRSRLPSTYDFTFIDAQNICQPINATVAKLYAGPYRSWYSSPSVTRMAAAHEAVRDRIKNEAPFDIILGFSQGAALAASLLCHEEIRIQQEEGSQSPSNASSLHPRLCRAAVFMCSPLPFSKSLKCGTDVRKYFGIKGGPPSSGLGMRAPHTTVALPETLMPNGRYLKPDLAELENYLDGEETGSEPISIGPFYQMFHSGADSAPKISIPTTHIIGLFDQLWRNHGRELVKMCTPLDGDGGGQRWVYEFEGGHEIPKDDEEIADVCDMIEELVMKIG